MWGKPPCLMLPLIYVGRTLLSVALDVEVDLDSCGAALTMKLSTRASAPEVLAHACTDVACSTVEERRFSAA